ncbi:MAG: cytochrome c1 [Rhodospirillaceae bacterium]|jgi:cytochrome c1|nr:cytochrome c1 [Rhodospirillaceae bacterium]MBT3884675.1 cytochrome c1 [Rhodospirillaceae bacterium]MBT4119233.1 cytochrome c1 [Rhodospirillaceae bacterium]MBT4674892.1 cytochrome c1 [Rhodospirillaceae bacterium]MBT4721118.1 cytochrome c1 [Rhodospirillaceae bacterium]
MGKIFIAAGLALGLSFGVFASDASASSGKAAPSQEWTFDGVFGNFDRAQLKRGYQVYQEVCAACHSLSQIYYRNLSEIGFTEDEVKKIAAEFEVPRGPDDEGETHEDGEQIMRAAKPFDKLVQPYANEQAARAANNGALPPDLSLVTKARKGGANYLHALLTGFADAPEGFKMQDGMSYNVYFPGAQIAMAPPIDDDAVEYADGTKASKDQISRDVAAFLTWTAEPELEDRKRIGIKVLIFLIIFTAMLYAVKRRVWAKLH